MPLGMESPTARDTAEAMSQENIDKLRRGYASLNRGDYADAVSMAHPDIEYFPPGAEQPAYRGVTSLRRWMEPDAFAEQAIEPLDFVAAGRKVLVKHRIRAR